MTKSSLAFSLAQDLGCPWPKLLANWQTDLVDYMSKNCLIHTKEARVEIFNDNDFADLMMAYCRTQFSQQIVER
jgi:hypothetical protein